MRSLKDQQHQQAGPDLEFFKQKLSEQMALEWGRNLALISSDYW
jgi:hypothetical protein